MPLQPHPTEPGFFLDPLSSTAGSFAMIIGVSAYPHLEGGTGYRADPTYGLGQLAVSALTAHRFFNWIRDLYSFTDAPLSGCWVLVAPTAQELAAHPELANYPLANFANCARAIQQWHRSIAALHPQYAKASRAIFFFSGHGLERGRDRQILLPSDYLSWGSVDHAISTANLAAGLRNLGNLADIFFVDACRGLPKDMCGIEISGTKILNEYSSLGADPERFSPIVYATASGGETWQPKMANGDISVFGEALIEGLQREGARNRMCGHPAEHITLNPLTEFMNRRVVQLLGNENTGRFPIRVNDNADVCVTALPSLVPTVSPDNRNTFDAGGDLGGIDVPVVPDPPPPQRTLERRDVGGVVPSDQVFNELHGYFGHESLTQMWTSAELVPLHGNGKSEIRIDTFETFGKAGIRVSFRLDSIDNCWVEFPSQYTDVAYCAAFPGQWGPDVFRFAVEIVEDNGRPLSFEAALSLDNDGFIGSAARMWENLCLMQAKKALAEADAINSEEMLREKMASPVSATVAGIVLLRAREYDRLHDWLRNLSNAFPHLPDGAVLWAEQLRQTKRWEEEPVEIVEHLLRLEQRGLPLFAGTFEYALQIADELCTFTYSDSAVLNSEQEDRARRVRKLRDRLTNASRYACAGGLFQVYRATPHTLTADLIKAEHMLVTSSAPAPA